MELTDRAEAVARYKALRKINVHHQGECFALVPSATLIAQADRLGLFLDGHLIADERELDCISDLCLYTAVPGRSRVVDRYARTLKAPPGSDDRLVMDAMLNDRFSLWQVDRKHPVAGLVVRDIVRDEEAWLMDIGLEQVAPIGMLMASRLIQLDGISMTCGVAISLDMDMARDAYLACAGLKKGKPLVAVIQDRRYAAAVYEQEIERRRGMGLGEWAA